MSDLSFRNNKPPSCKICAHLADQEHASQKFGHEEDNTYLPAAAGQLCLRYDYEPFSSRKKQLWQCPECGTYYLYQSDYVYLVNGSEDEEWLIRLGDKQKEVGDGKDNF